MRDDVIVVEDLHAVRVIRLNRPRCGNAIDLHLAEGLERHVSALTMADEVRAVVLLGAGSSFCVGGDLRSFDLDDLPRAVEAVASRLQLVVTRLASLSVPVVAAVQGAAAGAGLGLAAACDLVVCGRSARFVGAYGALGLSPDAGASWFLARAMGEQRALEFLLTNRTMDAPEAEANGLVTCIVDDAEVEARAVALAHQVGARPSVGVEATKRLIRSATSSALEAQLEAETQQLVRAAASAQVAHRVREFTQRRARA